MGVNLDCLSIDPADLWAWFNAHKRGMNCARALFPDRPAGYVSATRDMANYAANKATAMQCRARGDMLCAGNYETICERIYSNLPAFAQW